MMRLIRSSLRAACSAACVGLVAMGAQWSLNGGSAMGQEPVTVGSLLGEMVDRDAAARYPSPAYMCRQASSYDRRSTSPDNHETWFANGDADQFVRVEQHDGRQERVLMDVTGPGAIVRFWSANPPEGATLRFYLDGSEEPTFEADFRAFCSGEWEAGVGAGEGAGEGVHVSEPMAAVSSRGWNSYLPIPYAAGCKVTCDKPGFYYQINHRVYEPGTSVETFTPAALVASGDALAEAIRLLKSPGEAKAPGEMRNRMESFDLKPGEDGTLTLPHGSNVVRMFAVKLDADDLADATRSTVIECTFDTKVTVWVPVGSFFGTGVGFNKYQGWWRGSGTGSAACMWPMPYGFDAKIRVVNTGDQEVKVRVFAAVGPWLWDDRSMHFNATWKQEDPIHTRPMRDWNFVEIKGQGVYMGDTLEIANPVRNWWGEGDEKIYVDGETFPSHFGTGTEDYYGYAWGCPEPFDAPFHAQPRCDGPDNYGHTTVTRTRSLDAIPFTESLKFDMEVWHWKECDVGYAATTYFYTRPGATTNVEPMPAESARGALDPAPLPPPFKIEGAIECEEMEVVGKSEGTQVGPQGGFGPDLWSGDLQLWVQGHKVGDFVELRFPVEHDGPVRLRVHATRSWDYGIIQFSSGGKVLGEPVDLYNTKGRAVAVTGPIDLGVVAPTDGFVTLRAEVVGGNERSEGSKSFFGLDCVVVEPAGPWQ